ncbi:MAG: hypothetical protein CL943_04015 [Candidatus Diapherotrites archaeon]|uniref:Cation/H+ exchanger transmembrane domain-containing protein n=1 Tax=Candidatus Iainarchaeum sp. TaxID=3101447 RepID=A0A2D6M1W8_9ARCH|nr:hypothetical protein [Candidatus Diapherotrites archaeon]|tara:strand:- start:448 stop:1623 length:1176 start_codon:yes stop_codon:yes gene_type:complete
MTALLSFFVLLFAGLIFSDLFKRLHLPYVTALIVAGVIIGPVLNIVSVDPTISFLGGIGLVFLMFIAGSEIKTGSFKRLEKEIFVLALLNGVIPFATGFGIAWFLTQSVITSYILGIAFISSSVAIIIPSLEARGLLNRRIGETIVSATVFEDMISLLLFAIVLQNFTPKTALPLIIYIPLIILIPFLLKLLIPRIEQLYHYNKRGRDLFESQLRFVFAILIATVVLFESLGMHAIVAGFVIGIILSDSIRGKVEEKIRTISYGFFIPIFFLIIGMGLDLGLLLSSQVLISSALIVTGLIASKVISGFIGGKYLLKFSVKESLLIGFATTPQLSTTLAVAFVALESGLLSADIITALILLSTITAFIAPLAIRSIPLDKEPKATVLNTKNK